MVIIGRTVTRYSWPYLSPHTHTHKKKDLNRVMPIRSKKKMGALISLMNYLGI